LANRLLSRMVNKAPEPELRQLLQSLLAEIARHFEDEEQLLEECAFGGLETHRQEHARLLEQADNWLRSSQNGMPLLTDVFNFIVGEVMANHLLAADRDYFDHLGPASGG